MNSTNKLHYLDGLRGVASLVVYFHHFLLLVFPPFYFLDMEFLNQAPSLLQYFATTPLRLLFDGTLAVQIFFIHSGFVLCYQFFYKSKISKELRYDVVVSSAIRRYFRLTIPLAGSILFAYFLIKLDLTFAKEADLLSPGNKWIGGYYNFDANLWEVIKQGLVTTYTGFKSNRTYNPNLWTLVYELKGSYFIYALCLLTLNTKNRWIVYILIIPFIQYHNYFISFLLGYICCDLYFCLGEKIRPSNVIGVILLFLGIYLGTVYDPNLPWYRFLNISFMEKKDIVKLSKLLGALFIFISIFFLPFLQKIFGSKIGIYLGKVSFSNYLLHFPILASLGAFLYIKGNGISNGVFSVEVLINFISCTAVLFIISHFYAIYIDQKSIDLGKTIFKKFFQKN